jgi:hypothetical protein
MPLVARRNPEYRRTRGRGLRVFAVASHGWYLLGALGLLATPRVRLAALLALPWLVTTGRRLRASRPRWRTLLALRVLISGADVAAGIAGSVRHRRLFL